MTIKATIFPDAAKREHLRREIEVARIVNDIGHIAAPRICGTFDDEHVAGFVEEYRNGVVPAGRRDAIWLAETLLPAFANHCREYGLRWVTARELLGEDFSDMLRTFASVALCSRTEKQRLQDIGEELLKNNRLLPLSLCHGDLGQNHIVVSSVGRPLLIDWGSAGEKPIARDLFRISAFALGRSVKHREACAQTLDGLAPPRRLPYGPREQFMLSVLSLIPRWWSKCRTDARKTNAASRIVREARTILGWGLPRQAAW